MNSYHHEDGWSVSGNADAIHALIGKLARLRYLEVQTQCLEIELDILLEGNSGAAQNAVREEGPQWMVKLVDKYVTPLRDELHRLRECRTTDSLPDSKPGDAGSSPATPANQEDTCTKKTTTTVKRSLMTTSMRMTIRWTSTGLMTTMKPSLRPTTGSVILVFIFLGSLILGAAAGYSDGYNAGKQDGQVIGYDRARNTYACHAETNIATGKSYWECGGPDGLSKPITDHREAWEQPR